MLHFRVYAHLVDSLTTNLSCSSDSIMLYKIDPLFTENNFSTKTNAEISVNDQYYAAQLYMNFIDKDYEDCRKNISCHDENYFEKVQCYNTWYKYCMIFVRDYQSCKMYNNSKAEYKYYMWMKSKTQIFPCENTNKIRYQTSGIKIDSSSFTAALIQNAQKSSLNSELCLLAFQIGKLIYYIFNIEMDKFSFQVIHSKLLILGFHIVVILICISTFTSCCALFLFVKNRYVILFYCD